MLNMLITASNKKHKTKISISLKILLLAMTFYTGNCLALLNLPQPPAAPKLEKTLSKEDIERLSLSIAYVKEYYVKPANTKTLVDNAISGMLSKLDPHSDFQDESDLKDLELVTFGKFGGIGVEVLPDNGAIRIVSPLDDTPAAKAGIKAGDLIIQINNQLVKDLSLRNAINMMRGPRGSYLKLTVLRKNESKPLKFNLRRDMIRVQTVKSRLLEPNYGYVRIAFFQAPTERDLIAAVTKLKKQNGNNLRGVVIDLRNNPGGLLESAIQIADDFLDAEKLKDNKLIVYTKGQIEGAHITANATPDDILSDVPMVILINEGSASAAEIVAGALQDHKRAVIVGTRSFGKGSVQTLLPLSNKSAIKLTTALYYTPHGRSIQAKGIEPDIVVDELELAKNKKENVDDLHIDESKLADHLENGESKEMHKNHDDDDFASYHRFKPTFLRKAKSEPLAHSDYQLYEALNILKGLNVMPKK